MDPEDEEFEGMEDVPQASLEVIQSQALEAVGSVGWLGLTFGLPLRVPPLEHHVTMAVDDLDAWYKQNLPPPQVAQRDMTDATASPRPASERLLLEEFWDLFVNVDERKCREQMMAEQGSDAWLAARRFCLTGTAFHDATRNGTREGVLKNKLWPNFRGNMYTRWGNVHEDDARDAFCGWFRGALTSEFGPEADDSPRRFTLHETGLVRFPGATPFLGVSPDGLVSYTDADGEVHVDLVEFKCPAGPRRKAPDHPYASLVAGDWRFISHEYLAQVQGIMGVLNEPEHGVHRVIPGVPQGTRVQRAWHVAWQPHAVHVMLVPFSAELWAPMRDELVRWYHTVLLPNFVLQHNGLLDGASREVEYDPARVAARMAELERELLHGGAAGGGGGGDSPVREPAPPSPAAAGAAAVAPGSSGLAPRATRPSVSPGQPAQAGSSSGAPTAAAAAAQTAGAGEAVSRATSAARTLLAMAAAAVAQTIGAPAAQTGTAGGAGAR